MQEILNKQFPFFNAELMDSIVAHGQWVQVAAGEVILKHRAYVKVIPLVSSGLLKVSRLEDDKELLLYYIKPGESCVMSLTACLHNQQSQVLAITEEASELLLIPAHFVQEWMHSYPAWNSFVYDMFNLRYTELLQTIDSLIFHSMDQRIRSFLLDKAGSSGTDSLEITHLEIARQLNTAREVVSRIMKKLETEYFIRQDRGKITLLH